MKPIKEISIKCHLLAILFAIFSISLLGCDGKDQPQILSLEDKCKDLNQETGKDYQAFIGKYLGSKSRTSGMPSHSGHEGVNHQMYLNINDQEIKINFGAIEKEIPVLFDTLNQVLGSELIKDKQDSTEKFGICAYQNFQKIYFGDFKTLTKISD